jgi:hypothetical protein
MDTPNEHLKAALIQLKVSIMDIDLLRNNSIDHCDELDKIKENLDNAFLIITKVLNDDLAVRLVSRNVMGHLRVFSIQ